MDELMNMNCDWGLFQRKQYYYAKSVKYWNGRIEKEWLYLQWRIKGHTKGHAKGRVKEIKLE